MQRDRRTWFGIALPAELAVILAPVALILRLANRSSASRRNVAAQIGAAVLLAIIITVFLRATI